MTRHAVDCFVAKSSTLVSVVLQEVISHQPKVRDELPVRSFMVAKWNVSSNPRFFPAAPKPVRQ
jgi:hypothetical protein